MCKCGVADLASLLFIDTVYTAEHSCAGAAAVARSVSRPRTQEGMHGDVELKAN